MQSAAKASKVEEFVAYDERGRAVVLRSNRQPSEEAAAVSPQKPTFAKNDPKSLFAPRVSKTSGALGFFAGFSQVRARFSGQGR